MYIPITKWYDRPKDIHPNGYILIYVPEHPKSFRGGWYYEHRMVAEKHLGRILNSWETIHHISEIKTHNEWDNLFVCTRSQHDRAA